MRPSTSPLNAVAYRGVSGLRPLWWTPNLGFGRWHGAAQPAPVQYLCTHPMGPLAEQARHAGAHTPEELRQLRRNVFALRVRLERVLVLDFERAAAWGLDPAALVGPPSSYPVCSRWLGENLQTWPEVQGLLVPSAALPGTDTLVVVGKRHPFPYLSTPRRVADIPCAAAALDAHALTSLSGVVRRLEATEHTALDAWRSGGRFTFVQPPLAA
jgi:RES domain-containing protein